LIRQLGEDERLIRRENVGARSYLDALSDYETVTQEAIDLSRRKGSNAQTSQNIPRELELDAGPNPGAVRAVMLRWHLSLLGVLKTGQHMVHRPLELTTDDIAE
jgi:hypothetical protein